MGVEMMMVLNPDLSPEDLSLIPALPAEMMSRKTAAAVIALIKENCESWQLCHNNITCIAFTPENCVSLNDKG